MPAPLSLDLRERIVRAVENGSSIRQAALRFEVSPSAAVKLLRRVRASGNAAPARFGGHRRPILDEHEDRLTIVPRLRHVPLIDARKGTDGISYRAAWWDKKVLLRNVALRVAPWLWI